MQAKLFQPLLAAMAFALCLVGAGPAQAATVVTPGGVTNVTVGADIYDVVFVPSMNIEVWPGYCYSLVLPCATGTASQFADITSAANALSALATILNLPANIGYLPAGCIDLQPYCYIMTRYGAATGSYYGWGDEVRIANFNATLFAPVAPGATNFYTFQPGLTYAVWSKVQVVPLPASGLILLAGLAGLAGLRRRRAV